MLDHWYIEGQYLKSTKYGKGALDRFKRTSGLLPPKARKLLKKVGNEKIKNIVIFRQPISKYNEKLINILSFGKFKKALNKSPYDKMLHLGVLINGKYLLDKQSVIHLKKTKTKDYNNNVEIMEIKNIDDDLTINELLLKTRKYMGDKKFSEYNAKKNNCQDFIIAILNANNINSEERKKFIKQDAKDIISKLPNITKKIIKFTTDIGAIYDRIVEGEGKNDTYY